jgi:predicted permease
MRIDAGFDPEQALTMRLSVPGPAGAESEEDRQRYRAFLAGALRRLRDIPGVTAAGAVSALPMSGWMSDEIFDIEGRVVPPGAARRDEELRTVTPGWFAAAGMRILRGRDVADADGPDRPFVVVVNEAFARKHFPGDDALGKRITFDDGRQQWMTIVGVVNDVREFGLDADVKPIMYVPHAQRPGATMTLVLRSPQPLADLARAAQSAVAALDPRQPVFAVRPLRELVSGSLAQRTFALLVVQAFSLVALLLAGIGLYGVLAYSVARRTREFGIRVALGARRAHVLGLVARESAAVVLAGVAAGLAGALVAARSAASLVYGADALDVPALLAATAVLAAVCGVATLLPARRATRVDPAVALQAE